MKTKIYNLIILDESGSMQSAATATINGCNETINVIRAAQEAAPDTQEHFLSIFAFQSGASVPSRYIVKNVPAAAAVPVTAGEYRPLGMTPLYDAIGSTLTDLKISTDAHEHAIGAVTIITDGYENASHNYTGPQIAKMIAGLKELGWNFNFIGANIDVEKVAAQMNITNHMTYTSDSQGTKMMFEKESRSRMAYYNRVSQAMAEPECDGAPSFSERMKEASEDYFNE